MRSEQTCQMTFNGEKTVMQQQMTIDELIEKQSLAGRFVIVVNDEIVPKSAWSSQILQAGDAVEVISPISGG